jgi:thioredoxin 1
MKKKKMSFQEIIRSDQPVLIDFSAEWCGPCRAMEPILKKVAKDFAGKAKVIKIDIDKNRRLAEKHNIMGVPTFMIFQKGQLKWRQSGMISAHFLSQVIQKEISN